VAPPVTTHRYEEAYRLVLAHAGASLPRRDAVDRRVIDETRNCTGRIINDPREVGGWPELKPGPAPRDADRDGMPDEWETEHALNPQNNNDAAGDKDGDGYTNVEEWINGTEP
jgi:hypothetical protein